MKNLRKTIVPVFINLIYLLMFLTGQIIAQDKVEPKILSDIWPEDHPILLVFSGSDWCMPCIRLDKEILTHQRFLTFAKNKITVVKADFPQRKKLNKEVTVKNDLLAERFNPSGTFPKILLIQDHQSAGDNIGYTHWSVDMLIQEIKDKIKARTHKAYEQQELLMGTQFGFTLVDTINSKRVPKLLQQCINEVKRLEYLLSEWIDTTEVSELNYNAGKQAIRVDPELYGLIKRCNVLSGLTQGAFDITFASLGHLWKFDRLPHSPPDSITIQKALSIIGHQNIELRDSSQVFLKYEGMKIGFGGMGKGYSADRVRDMMKAQGIEDGVINASGDLVAWGKPPGEDYWKIAIADPSDPEKILFWLPINDKAVATSGDYENFLEIDGVRYAHIIDPKTGYPTTGIRSVTVISYSAELSDALATALFVLGVDVGIDLLEQLPNVSGLIIDAQNQVHFSSKLEYIKNGL